jgi:hypothetical protein
MVSHTKLEGDRRGRPEAQLRASDPRKTSGEDAEKHACKSEPTETRPKAGVPGKPSNAETIRKTEPTVSSNRINSGHLASDSAGIGVHSTADSVSCPAFHSANETKEYESSA